MAFIDLGIVLGVRWAVVDGVGEDGVFDGPGALEAPLVLRDGIDEFVFVIADGCEARVHHFDVRLVCDLVFRTEDGYLAGEAVTEGVQAGSLFTCVRFGTGGFEGVGQVGGELGGGNHMDVQSFRLKESTREGRFRSGQGGKD